MLICIIARSWIILGMGSANERRRDIVTASLIGRAHTQNDACPFLVSKTAKGWFISRTIVAR